ncbi:fibronectin type III domain-containing protein [Lactococcus sp.]|uniref:fibronectin type III domain-containing protein n=1 Tax=Lactococcus sp. TaxID=44273 RepID=UPI002FC90D20
MAYLIHYGDANTTDPHDAKYMGYSETTKFTLAASDVPVGATTGDKIPFYVQAYNVVAPSGTTNVEKAAALHDAPNITGSAWSTVVEVIL